MIDDTIIEKKYAEKIQCVYNLYSSRNKGFIKGISLTVLLWTNGVKTIPIKFQPYAEIGKLKGAGHKVSVTKHCKRYYASNQTENRITSQFIVKEYRVRWKIEVLFGNLKQLCRLEECQSRRTITQRDYVYVCMRALIMLEE